MYIGHFDWGFDLYIFVDIENTAQRTRTFICGCLVMFEYIHRRAKACCSCGFNNDKIRFIENMYV